MRSKWNLLLIALMSTCLTACVSMQVDEANFIHPDSKSGYKVVHRFDDAALQRVTPGAVLQEQLISIDKGLELHGLSVRQSGTTTTVLYFGGNMYHLDDGAPYLVKAITSCGANLISFDYRGYGRSSGKPSVSNMQEDALRIYDAVREQVSGKLIVHGQSLGSFIAGYVAQQRKLDGLVLESTATNAYDWAVANTPWYAKPFIDIELSPALQNIDNAKAVSDYRGHGLVLVGDRDKVTPMGLGQKVYQSIPSANKRMFVSTGGDHNGLLQRPDIMDAYCTFVKSVK